jgi:hypothetical protein
MNAHGVPAYSVTSDPEIYPQQLHLMQVSVKDGKNMVGNGIHLHAFGSWYVHCMSNCVPRNMLLRYAQPMPAFCRADLLEDDAKTEALLAGPKEHANEQLVRASKRARLR